MNSKGKKVLIVGVGKYGKKYISYFKKEGYEVYGVCKTNKTKYFISGFYGIRMFLNSENIDCFDFSYITITLPILIQGEEALKYVKKYLNSQIIIQIPVSFKRDIIKELINYKNVIFFLEEEITLLSRFLSKISNNIDKIGSINLVLKLNSNEIMNKDAKKVALIHVFNNFLSIKNINIFFTKLNFKYEISEDIENFYCISFFYNGIYIKYKFGKKIFFKIGRKIFYDDYNFDKIMNHLITNLVDNKIKQKKFLENYDLICKYLVK